MKVRLAAQVLSNTVGTALRRYYSYGKVRKQRRFVRWAISFLTVSILDQLLTKNLIFNSYQQFFRTSHHLPLHTAQHRADLCSLR